MHWTCDTDDRHKIKHAVVTQIYCISPGIIAEPPVFKGRSPFQTAIAPQPKNPPSTTTSTDYPEDRLHQKTAPPSFHLLTRQAQTRLNPPPPPRQARGARQ